MGFQAWTHKCWPTSNDLYSFAQCRHWIPSKKLAKRDGRQGQMVKENQEDLCNQHDLTIDIKLRLKFNAKSTFLQVKYLTAIYARKGKTITKYFSSMRQDDRNSVAQSQYIYNYTHIHAETKSTIMMSEHTSLEKIYLSHFIQNGCERVTKGLCKGYVGEVSWRLNRDCNILTPISSIFSSTSFSFCWAAQPGALSWFSLPRTAAN